MGLSGRLLEILSRNKFVLRGAESQNDFLCAKVKRGWSETCLRTSSVKIFSYHHPIFQHGQCLPILNLNLLSLSLAKTSIIASTLSCDHSMMSSTNCTLYRFSWKMPKAFEIGAPVDFVVRITGTISSSCVVPPQASRKDLSNNETVWESGTMVVLW